MDKQNVLKIVLWNSNGLSQHTLEITSFLNRHSVDILLVSETHFTQKSYLNIPNYSVLYTNHPDNTAHGGTAIIIRKNIQCTELEKFRKDCIQATSIQIEDTHGPLVISAAYCPPKHNNTRIEYLEYLKSLGHRFIAGGDFNSKNTIWGSRLTLPKGKQLLEAIREYKSNFLSAGEPTYWPTNVSKKPDLIDFFITKNINHDNLKIESCSELSSDHSPIILNYHSNVLLDSHTKYIYNKKTDWDCFREILEKKLPLNVSLKTKDEVDTSLAYLNNTIILAADISSPIIKQCMNNYSTPSNIKEKIKSKRKLRKKWQTNRSPQDKTLLNKLTKELKDLLKKDKEDKLERYLKNLDSSPTSNYSLFKATKKINNGITHNPPIQKADLSWARTNSDKANVLAEHFCRTFTNPMDENATLLPSISNTQHCQIKKITINEIEKTIKTSINNKKAPGYDQITGKLLKELPRKTLIYIRNIFNVLININYFPNVWKVAEIIAIPKPNKDATKATSYRPISLLPLLSKLFEKLLYARLEPILNERNLIPNHQFGFRRMHSTIQQIHRVTNKISSDIDKKNFCVGTYLDVAKAFDSVWHPGLLLKLGNLLPPKFFLILRSYLENRKFYVKYKDQCSNIMEIQAGVPQGSVLGPLLYLLFTADIPTPQASHDMIATFADDTVLLSASTNINSAIQNLQVLLNTTLNWFQAWGIQVNSDKTSLVIYTNRKVANHQSIQINNSPMPLDIKAKYLGMVLDAKLIWKDHIIQKRNELNNKFRQLYWLLGKESKLSIQNKLLIYKTIISPIWKYGVELWGTASNSNIKIIQRIQSKILRTIVNAEWYISDEDLHRDLGVKTVKEVIQTSSCKHSNRLTTHSNNELRQLHINEAMLPRRLKRFTPTGLSARFT